MRRFRLKRPSPAMAVACIALFAAMGGVGYAAATVDSADIVDNSIRSRDVRNENVRGKDIADSSLGTSDIANNSLKGRDVKGDALDGSDINESSLGLGTAGNSNQNDADIASLGAAFVTVAQTTINTTRSGFVLASGSAELFGNGGSTGECLIVLDGASSLSYEVDPDDAGAPFGANQAVAAVNFGRALAAGSHTASLQCRAVQGTVGKDDGAINLIGVGA